MEIPSYLTEDSVELPSNNELAEISALAEQQKWLMIEVTKIEAELETAKEALRKIQEEALPAAMDSIGMTKFTLTDGSTITIKEEVYPSIRADFISQAVEWLDSIGCSGVVKDEVKVNFGKGESKLAKQIIDLASSLGVVASEKMSIHPSTFKALVKDQRKKGIVFPEEFFSITDKKFANIK